MVNETTADKKEARTILVHPMEMVCCHTHRVPLSRDVFKTYGTLVNRIKIPTGWIVQSVIVSTTGAEQVATFTIEDPTHKWDEYATKTPIESGEVTL